MTYRKSSFNFQVTLVVLTVSFNNNHNKYYRFYFPVDIVQRLELRSWEHKSKPETLRFGRREEIQVLTFIHVSSILFYSVL